MAIDNLVLEILIGMTKSFADNTVDSDVILSIMIVTIIDLGCVVVSYPSSAPACRIVSEIKQNLIRNIISG